MDFVRVLSTLALPLLPFLIFGVFVAEGSNSDCAHQIFSALDYFSESNLGVTADLIALFPNDSDRFLDILPGVRPIEAELIALAT